MTERVKRAAWGTAVSLLLVLCAVGAAEADGVRVGSEAEVIAEDGANLRAEPSTDARIIVLVGQARYVFVQAGPEGGWYRVEYDGAVGWVYGGLLGPARPRTSSRGDAVGRPVDEPSPAGPPAGLRIGVEAQVATADGVNLRREPSTAAAVVDLVKNARIVYLLDGPSRNGDGVWYKVDFDGSIGWVMGSYLGPLHRGAAAGVTAPTRARPAAADPAQTAPDPAMAKTEPDAAKADAAKGDAAKADPAPSRQEAAKPDPAPATADAAPARLEAAAKPAAAPAKPEPPKAAPTPSRGDQIAQRALALVGLAYAWGGSSPRTGFDCSGLIAYVMGQFGIYPGRTADAQAGAGTSVKGGDLLPGDIVVFANTYAGGYSHTGIYVGGGRFVHAEDYGTGVVVSPVFGGYWARHYAGARRVW